MIGYRYRGLLLRGGEEGDKIKKLWNRHQRFDIIHTFKREKSGGRRGGGGGSSGSMKRGRGLRSGNAGEKVLRCTKEGRRRTATAISGGHQSLQKFIRKTIPLLKEGGEGRKGGENHTKGAKELTETSKKERSLISSLTRVESSACL